MEVGRFSVVEVGRTPLAAEELSSSRAPAGAGGPRTLLLGGHVDHEVHHPVAVAEFIVVPGRREREGLFTEPATQGAPDSASC